MNNSSSNAKIVKNMILFKVKCPFYPNLMSVCPYFDLRMCKRLEMEQHVQSFSYYFISNFCVN